ncbi:hypothetical protein BDV12DRAFT_74794 [Aspergillus spectabilis]
MGGAGEGGGFYGCKVEVTLAAQMGPRIRSWLSVCMYVAGGLNWWVFSIVLGVIKRSTLNLYSIHDHRSSIVSHVHVHVHDHTSCPNHSLSPSIPPLFFFQKQINQREPENIIPRSREKQDTEETGHV